MKRGVAASVIVAVGIDAGAEAAAAAGGLDDSVVGGVLTRVLAHDSALVSVAGRGATRVTLARDAFVSHGVDGRTADLTPFLPGERVAVRGTANGSTITADEFQSVYTEDVGVVATDGNGGLTLKTQHGPVAVPADVTVRSTAGGRGRIAPGATSAATLWTNPVTGDRTALMLRVDG